MIRIFIGTEPNQHRADRVLEHSLLANTNAAVEITWMRYGEPGWTDFKDPGPTNFTMFRFAIPELCDFQGPAIYLDCDMMVLGDVEELIDLYQPGKWVKFQGPDGDAVSVIDCSAVQKLSGWPSIEQLKTGKLRKWDVRGMLAPILVDGVPRCWNSVDVYEPGTKLVHFSNLTTQPWEPVPGFDYEQHQDRHAADLWHTYERMVRQ